MKKTTASPAQVATVHEELPVRVQEALGELAAAAREGLLALSVGVGLGVLAELMEEEVVEVVGAKGKHDRERVAVRHGHEAGEVTLGGRRVGVVTLVRIEHSKAATFGNDGRYIPGLFTGQPGSGRAQPSKEAGMRRRGVVLAVIALLVAAWGTSASRGPPLAGVAGPRVI